jgi:isopenicillin-N epimerase
MVEIRTTAKDLLTEEGDASACALKTHFLLDPDVVFLNHGSFGACPRPVFEDYQHWQLELERQPVEFIGRRVDGLLDRARMELAGYLHVDPDHLTFVTNATSGLNVIARSLPLEREDEILTTDHEYGALNMTWELTCSKVGARYIRHPVHVPVTTPEAIVDSFWSAVTARTRIIFLSHITSPTSLILPVKEICSRAREAGILTVIDGAHAPGQIPLDLEDVGADIYAGNCHKWMCAPKGSAFLYARPEHHDWIESLTISWGWMGEHTFVTRNQKQGTRDAAAFLATPAAIRFMTDHDWECVRARCHDLAREARTRVAVLTGMEPISPDSGDWFSQMISCPLPPQDALALKTRMYDEFRVEAPIVSWNGQTMIRFSFQGYNTTADLDRAIAALEALL